jgi:Amt family ammonium transporter
MVGNLLTYVLLLNILIVSGLFAADYIAALDGISVIPGGWLNQNYIQLAYQLCDCVTGFTYSFGMTCIILFLMNLVPGLSLRASEEAEILGIDEAEIGEFAYDFVEKERDYIHGHEGVDGAVVASSSSSGHGAEKGENIV